MTDEAKNVLRVVSKEAADGYTVLSRTNLNPNQLINALKELIEGAFVRVEGDLNPSAVGKSYIWVPTDRKGEAEMMSRFS